MICRIFLLSDAQLTVVRFSGRCGALKFLDAAQAPLAGIDGLETALAALPPVDGAGERTVLCLPPRALSFRELRLPISDRNKLREVLPLELQGETARDVADLQFDAVPGADGASLAVWTPRAELAAAIRALTAAGREPEIATAALFCWRRLLPPEERGLPVALCDGSAVAVFRNGAPLFARALTGLDPRADLAETLAVLEASPGITPSRLYLFGAAAAWCAPDGGLAGTTVPVAALPLSGFLAGTFGNQDQDARNLASAAAVAGDLAADSGGLVDFRSGPLATTIAREQLRRSLRLTSVLAGMLVLLLFGRLGLRWQLARRDLDSLEASIRAIYREALPKRTPVDPVAELRVEVKRLAGETSRGNLLGFLKSAAEAKGPDVGGIYEVELDRDLVRLKGEARSVQAVDGFRGRLNAPGVGSFEGSEIRTKGDGGVVFTLQGKLRGGAP